VACAIVARTNGAAKLILKGISSGEMGAALKVLLGPDAAGLSANTVSRLKRDWAKEYDGWREAELDDEPLVYIWADGVHSGLRGEDDKLCALVIVGVTARGQQRFLAIEDGVRESTQSWREVLLSLKSRGMNAPKLAIGPSHRLQTNDCQAVDGAMGFGEAQEKLYPETRQQRCWQHKTMNVLNCLPKLSQRKAKAAIHNIWQAETKDDAEKAFDLFVKIYEPKYPKAALCLQKDRTELMAFFDFPSEHWQSIRTSNPTESAFATIWHRIKRSKGSLSRDGMLHMMFKLGQCAEQNWRKLCGFDYPAKVITGVTFKDGIETTKPDPIAA
jgi:putative transposase